LARDDSSGVVIKYFFEENSFSFLKSITVSGVFLSQAFAFDFRNLFIANNSFQAFSSALLKLNAFLFQFFSKSVKVSL
jgi:hypothetical protein